MIAGALAYYQYHSWRNRMTARVRRLRDPKYLAGAMVGGLYFYFYLFRGFGLGRHGGAPAPKLPAAAGVNDLPQTLAALGFMIVLLLAWIFPHTRTALSFSEAEVSFLFPAPIGRKTLIHFKLLKSQIAILFSALLITLIRRNWAGGPFIPHVFAVWAGLSVLNLHLLGSSFVLTMLMDRGISTWRRRVFIIGGVVAAVAGLFLWARHSLPPPPGVRHRDGFAWLFQYAGQVVQSGPLPYILLPFRMVVAPYFAASYRQFLVTIGPALAIIGLHYLWVTRSNVAFEEASVDLSRKIADRLAAVRSGNWQAARQPKKTARPPFVLRPRGHPAVALFWKNLISMRQYVTARVWVWVLWVGVVAGIFLQAQSRHGHGLALGMMFVVVILLLCISLFSGPQVLRNDLRQDLPVADLLKMYPMRGWQIVLGEVLAPAAVLTGAQWLLLLLGAITCPAQLDHQTIPPAWRLSVALGLAAVLPCVNLLALLIRNAAVLFFPAWIQLGRDGPRGFETTGQQLILTVGQLLVLLFGLMPAGAAFGLFFAGASYVRWPVLGLLLGAFAAAIVLAVEAAFAIKLLGGAFERFDVSRELVN